MTITDDYSFGTVSTVLDNMSDEDISMLATMTAEDAEEYFESLYVDK